jgi:MFS family permease
MIQMERSIGAFVASSRLSFWRVSTRVCIPHDERLSCTDFGAGSQIILYFIGGSISFIEEDLKLTHGTSWLSTANVLATAVVSPYAGYLQDLFGKRYIALFGSLCLCIGCALTGSAHTFGQILTGMALTGVGAAIGELTALAG